MTTAVSPAPATAPVAAAVRTTNDAAALVSLALATLLSSLGTSIANVALPIVAQDFGASFPSVQWVVLAYLLAITTLIVAAGRLGDSMGPRRILLTGLGLFTSASVLCGFAPALPWLVAARALQGIGAAAMMALSLSLIATIVSPNRMGSAMGWVGTMSALGTALGPSLGGALIAAGGWRWVFLAPAPLGCLAMIFAYRHIASNRPHAAGQRAQFDVAGTVLLILALACYATALTPGRGRFGFANAALLGLAIVASGALFVVESKVHAPLIRVDLLGRRILRTGLLSTGLVASVLMATLVVGPFHLSQALGLDAVRVGFVMMCGPVVAALAGVPSGRLVDRWGADRAVRVGLLGILAGTLGLTLLPLAYGVVGYVVPIILITAGYALFQAANNSAVMAAGMPGERGVVSGLLNLARNLGLITGASGLGTVFTLAAGSADISRAEPAAVALGTRVTFGVAAALTVTALAFAYRAESFRRKRP